MVRHSWKFINKGLWAATMWGFNVYNYTCGTSQRCQRRHSHTNSHSVHLQQTKRNAKLFITKTGGQCWTESSAGRTRSRLGEGPLLSPHKSTKERDHHRWAPTQQPLHNFCRNTSLFLFPLFSPSFPGSRYKCHERDCWDEVCAGVTSNGTGMTLAGQTVEPKTANTSRMQKF